MYLIVIGAGPVGEHFVRLALDNGHDVVLLEADEQRAEYCAQNYDARVLHATIGEEGILDEAGAQHADALIATTEDDSIKLMAMVIGEEHDIANLTSTVNSRHRAPLFQRLRVHTLVDPEVLAARYLMDLVLHPEGEAVASLPGRGEIYELELGTQSQFAQRSVGALEEDDALPQGCCIVLIERDDELVYPRTDTRLQAEDTLLVFSPEPLSRRAREEFTGDGK